MLDKYSRTSNGYPVVTTEFGDVANGDYIATLTTVLPASNRKVGVEVIGPRSQYGGTWVGAQVNWPAIGSVVAEDAKAFASLMTKAAEAAVMITAWMDEFIANHQDWL